MSQYGSQFDGANILNPKTHAIRISVHSPEILVRPRREAGEGAVAMTTREEGFNLREAELSADLAGH